VDDEGPGLLDTNIFLHAHTSDVHAEECRQFLALLESGRLRARLEPMVLHELSYVLPRYVKQMTKQDVAEYLITVLSWVGVVGETDLLIETVERWAGTPGLSFADAYLATLATRLRCPVFTKNLQELRGQGADAPSRLPDGS
jgi:predicted nucleic acid-binding protein